MLSSVASDSVSSLVDFNQVSKIASVIRYDACGKSITGGYSWQGMTDELFNLANLYKFRPLILGGTSMGSGTAIHFAVRYPDDFNHPLEIAQKLNELISGSELVLISDYDEYLKFQEKYGNFSMKSVVITNRKYLCLFIYQLKQENSSNWFFLYIAHEKLEH